MQDLVINHENVTLSREDQEKSSKISRAKLEKPGNKQQKGTHDTAKREKTELLVTRSSRRCLVKEAGNERLCGSQQGRHDLGRQI